MTLKRAVLELRSHLGLSQPEFGARLGVSKQSVSFWERGQTSPRTSHLSVLIGLAQKSRAPRDVSQALRFALDPEEARA